MELLGDPFAHEEIGNIFIFEIPSPSEISNSRWGSEEKPEEKLSQALLELPAVVCGILDGGSELTAWSADVVLGTEVGIDENMEASLEASISKLENAVSQNPVAGLALVQLLRMGRNLSVRDQLMAESFTYSTLQGGQEFKDWLEKRGEPTPSKTHPQKHEPEPAVLSERTNGLLKLTLNRPQKHNAFSAEMRDCLVVALRAAYLDDALTQVQLQANGESFSAGGDLDEFGTTPNPATAHQIRSMRNAAWWLHQLQERMGQKVGVEVKGACIGAGIELPAFTQNVQASPNAFFQLPEISLGLVPGAGGTSSIPRRIGKHKTNWLALTGETLDAKKALDWGLIDRIKNGTG